MLIKYCFDVVGTLVFKEDILFEFKGRKYEFETEDYFLKKLIVTVRGNAKTDAPRIDLKPNQSQIDSIEIITPDLNFIQVELRNLEGLLSPFGIEEININYPEISWIAETEEEKELIGLFKYKGWIDRDQVKAKLPPLPLDLMARAILAAYGSEKWQIPLAFYRKGFTDYKYGRFLEACYDYYFLVETLYSGGKFRHKDVKDNFRQSKELQSAIYQVIKDKEFMTYLKGVSHTKFMKFVHKKSSEDISDFFVDFRGRIHHHSGKDKKKWHPANDEDFKFEAELFVRVSFNIGMKITNDQLFSDQLKLDEIKLKQRVRGN